MPGRLGFSLRKPVEWLKKRVDCLKRNSVQLQPNQINDLLPGFLGRCGWQPGMQIIISRGRHDFTLTDLSQIKNGQRMQLWDGEPVAIMRRGNTLTIDYFELPSTLARRTFPLDISVIVPEGLSEREIFDRNLEFVLSPEYSKARLRESQGGNTRVGVLAVNILTTPEGRFVEVSNSAKLGFETVTYAHHEFEFDAVGQIRILGGKIVDIKVSSEKIWPMAREVAKTYNNCVKVAPDGVRL
ncbi:MAG: hypothetical protein KKF07_03720 [Candidatus Margulisbacteria bacterium]|nr:hypothetical protein [Candidatus Margulisiibacteriota bacterium]MBU1729479.1 hypothetical protein [Candidatus Margulisiibacteriota bacterium]